MLHILNDNYGNLFFEIYIMRWFTCTTELVSHIGNNMFFNWVVTTMLSGGMRFHSCAYINIEYGTREIFQAASLGSLMEINVAIVLPCIKLPYRFAGFTGRSTWFELQTSVWTVCDSSHLIQWDSEWTIQTLMSRPGESENLHMLPEIWNHSSWSCKWNFTDHPFLCSASTRIPDGTTASSCRQSAENSMHIPPNLPSELFAEWHQRSFRTTSTILKAGSPS